MSRLLFTGERLHDDDPLFAVDLVRHRAAYAFAIALARGEAHAAILDLGCGTGYGARELAEALPRVVAVDRIAPDAKARHPHCRFIRADAAPLPLQKSAATLGEIGRSGTQIIGSECITITGVPTPPRRAP